MSQTELFPKSDETGSTMTINNAEIVAFDLDGERYCVDCAQDMDNIDCERFHTEPRSVPSGGSVLRQHIVHNGHEWHCGKTDCGVKIPGQE